MTPIMVCCICGNKHGKRHYQPDIGKAEWVVGRCAICGNEENVTDANDFGGLKRGTPLAYTCGTCKGRLL